MFFNMETKFRNKVISLIKENFSPFEFAVLFGIDKSNACAYLRGGKKIPLSLCFEVLEYLQVKLALFRS